jgi:hypothetical protein
MISRIIEWILISLTMGDTKTLFIVPTGAHYYKIIEMLKQFKIIILAPTRFGSRRNHHQGAVLFLAKTTKWFFCARQYRRSQCYGGISAYCAGVCSQWRQEHEKKNAWHLPTLGETAQQ